MNSKDLEVKIKWKLLERIAEYYEFPVAVFLHDIKNFPKQATRNGELKRKAELFDKIKELVEER